jgi:hypothetical protein
MKTFTLGIVLIFWMILTLLLAISIIGIFVLIREDFSSEYWKGEEGEAAWFKIGKSITKKLIN